MINLNSITSSCLNDLFQVKNIVTPRRVSVTVVSVFIVFLGSAAPVYTVNRFDNKYFPYLNKTLIGLVYAKDRESVEKVSFTVNHFLLPLTAFAIITISTMILVIKLQNVATWRKKSMATSQFDHALSRNQKVAKMVVMISSLFIACFLPISAGFLSVAVEPEISLEGKFRNIGAIMAAIGQVLESVNSSMNIFIYFHMSSKYKKTLKRLVCN